MVFSGQNGLFSNKKEAQNEDNFKENVKNSFKRAKEHISVVENELKVSREIIIKQNEQIKFLLEQIKQIHGDLGEIKAKKPLSEKSSSGNQGVYSAQTQHLDTTYSALRRKEEPKNMTLQLFPTSKEGIMDIFQNLSRQELMTFLTVYQLEDQIGHITYLDVASHLKLSEGCIRTYVSSLVRRGLPLNKVRHYNRQVFLSIPVSFRKLGIKEELLSLYHKPIYKDQRTLIEPY